MGIRDVGGHKSVVSIVREVRIWRNKTLHLDNPMFLSSCFPPCKLQ